MKFLKLLKTNLVSIRFESHKYADNYLLELLPNMSWVYKIDSWKLPKFERLFIGSRDYVSTPSYWTLAYPILLSNNEFRIYTKYVYTMFLLTKSIAFSWLWQNQFNTNKLHFYNHDFDSSNWCNLDDYTISSDNDTNTQIYTIFKNYTYSVNSEIVSTIFLENIFFDFFYILYYNSIFNSKRTVISQFSNSGALFSNALRYKFKNQTSVNSIMFILKKIRIFSSFFFKNIIIGQKTIITEYAAYKIKNVLISLNVPTSLKSFNIYPLRKANTFFLNKPVIFDNFCCTNYIATLLRKQKVFTKSKYARSRQYCKNIVFLGLLLNILLMFGLNSGYYAILINTGYCMHILYLSMILYSFVVCYKYKLFYLLSNKC